jgi:hypothetical protein
MIDELKLQRDSNTRSFSKEISLSKLKMTRKPAAGQQDKPTAYLPSSRLSPTSSTTNRRQENTRV